MKEKTCVPLAPYKRVLIVDATRSGAERRAEWLRQRGYQVDCAWCGDDALTLSTSRHYDIVVIAVQLKSTCISALTTELQKLNPDATIACLADCRKPIPEIPCDKVLWTGEPMEYFLARMDTLAATA